MIRAATLAWLAVLALSLGGCYSLGPEDTENATVVSLSYVPSTSGTGFSTGGKMVFTSTDPVYAVTLRCQHGNFAVEGGDESPAHALWRRVAVNDLLRVRYRPKVGHDGEVRGFRFVSAEKVRP